MCFSIPARIVKTTKSSVMLENGREIAKDPKIKAKKGDYAQMTGDIMVGILTKTEGEKFFSLLKNLNK